MARVIAHELRVFGVHGMAVRHYDGMLRAIASGAVRPGELVAKTIGLGTPVRSWRRWGGSRRRA